MTRPRFFFALALMVTSTASAQDRGFLAIGHDAGGHAFSFRGEVDAVNMCGTVDCEIVATFTACLGVAYSNPTQGLEVWAWAETASESHARVRALSECADAGGPACEVLNVYCLDAPALETALDLDRSARRFIQERLQASGFRPGSADGLFGPRTRGAIRQWQATQRVPATGYLTDPQINALESGLTSQLRTAVTGARIVDSETPGGGDGANSSSPEPPTADELEKLHWQSIVTSTDPSNFATYLEQYPRGSFRADAEAKLAELDPPRIVLWMDPSELRYNDYVEYTINNSQMTQSIDAYWLTVTPDPEKLAANCQHSEHQMAVIPLLPGRRNSYHLRLRDSRYVYIGDWRGTTSGYGCTVLQLEAR